MYACIFFNQYGKDVTSDIYCHHNISLGIQYLVYSFVDGILPVSDIKNTKNTVHHSPQLTYRQYEHFQQLEVCMPPCQLTMQAFWCWCWCLMLVLQHGRLIKSHVSTMDYLFKLKQHSLYSFTPVLKSKNMTLLALESSLFYLTW